MMPPARLWRGQRSGEPQLQRVFFNDVRGGQRVIHPDPDTDLVLAVMTASAMRQPTRTDVLEGVYRSETAPILRWGAIRLLSEVAPRHALLNEARSSGDPMLAAAASGR